MLVVLFVVMAVTVLSLGFLVTSDTELACGQNMALRTQMDQLADSALEHAKGLVLNPQEVSGEYWTGQMAQQLVVGSSDYYDVTVARDDSDPTNRCNYAIDCNAYRIKAGDRMGYSGLTAELRLDPAVVLWVDTATTLWQGLTSYGDVYTDATLLNQGVIDGDVFASSLSGSITGRHMTPSQLDLDWPNVRAQDYPDRVTVGSVLSNVTLDYPTKACYRSGDLTLAGDVQITGMLLVGGNLNVTGARNSIVAGKNLPALLVTGDVIVDNGADLDITGLAEVYGRVLVSSDSPDVDILGALFVRNIFAQTAWDCANDDQNGILYNGPVWQPAGGKTDGALSFDGRDDWLWSSFSNSGDAITISLWLKSDVTRQNRYILKRYRSFSSWPGWTDYIWLWYASSGEIRAFITTPWDWTYIRTTADVQTTAWQHLALVWEDGSSLKLYIDGQLSPLVYDKGPLTRPALSGSGQDIMYLGQGSGISTYWDGLIDDVRVYSGALDPNDIYPPVDGLPGLVAHWKLDEPGSSVTLTAAPARTAIMVPSSVPGSKQNWSQAAGAFFRSIRRK